MYILDSEDIESSHKIGESMEDIVQGILWKIAYNNINLDSQPFPITNEAIVNFYSNEEELKDNKIKSIITWIFKS